MIDRKYDQFDFQTVTKRSLLYFFCSYMAVRYEPIKYYKNIMCWASSTIPAGEFYAN